MAQAQNPNESAPLQGLRIAILCTDGVEQSELESPREALLKAGAEVEIVSPNSDRLQAWKHFDKADFFDVDTNLAHARVDDYDALVLPGGVANPDQLRADEDAVSFVKGFVENKKPIAAICHGPWTLIEAGAVNGEEITSWPSLKTDLTNAGARWKDASVVSSNLLVTSRKPDDLPDFNEAMITLFGNQVETRSEVGGTSLGKQKRSQDRQTPSVAPSAQI